MSAFAAISRRGGWATTDPLGIGGLLMDAGRVAQLRLPDSALLEEIIAAVLEGLSLLHREDFRLHASRRLAFRELGLAIGLHAAELPGLGALRPYLPLA